MLIMTTSSLNCNFLPSADMTFCLTMYNLLKRCNSRNYHIKFGTLRNAVRSIKKKKAIFTFFCFFFYVWTCSSLSYVQSCIWWQYGTWYSDIFFKHESSKLRYMYVIMIIWFFLCTKFVQILAWIVTRSQYVTIFILISNVCSRTEGSLV